MNNFTSDCYLDHLKESLLIDMLIIGLHDKKLQERLLRKMNLILDEFQNKVSQNSKKRYSKNRKYFEQFSKQEMIMKCSFALILTNVVHV